MTPATVTAQWVTAADGDRKRHLVTRDIDLTWVAACGAQFWEQDNRPVIPARCAGCLDEASRRDDIKIVTS